MSDTPRNNKTSHMNETFKALNDAVIPETFGMAHKQAPNRLSGISGYSIDEYLIWTLDHSLSQTMLKMVFNILLAEPTVKMLDKAARQLMKNSAHKAPIDPIVLREAGAFAALSPSDRLRAISLLEQLEVNPFSLPFPFFNNSGIVLSLIGTLMMLTTIGYYSGWTGYGSTRLAAPDQRRTECFPAGWQQAGYPGPSKGYHGFKGYLIEKFTD